MKYDSGMTHFHKDIIAALRYMLKDDSVINEKFSPKDGSPAPLRDYLKQKYGKICASHIGDGIRYSCNFSKGFKLTFDIILNNPGDKNLTLTWSQVTKFIRDNWDEVFKKSETEELPPSPQLSYIDKLREKYPKVSETDEWFDTVYCPSELFDGDVNDPGDEKCDYTTKDFEACQKCWRERCPENISFIENEDFEKEYFENYPEEDTAESDTVPENQIGENANEMTATVQNENPKVQAAFDYSELDGDTAKNLRDCETVIRQETAGYFTLLGAKFKEAQDLLANHANGTFEKWYTAMGFKRQTVYNLIQRYDFLGSPTIGGREDTFEALPLTLSYEVSKPDAPAELVEKVLDGDITTNAEYIKLKAELDRTRDECRQIDANSAAKDKEYEQELKEANRRAETEKKAREAISQNLNNMEEGYREYKDKYTEEYYKNADLEKRVKELESRPVDVAVQHDEKLLEELEELREENARLKDGVLHMVIQLTLDEYGNLVKLTQDDDALNYAVKHSHIFKS